MDASETNDVPFNSADKKNDHISDYVRRDATYRIKNKKEILAYLSKLSANHTLLSIRIEESERDLGSVILEVDDEHRCLLLDELYPRHELDTSPENKTLHLEARLDGVHLSFSCKVTEVNQEDGGEYCKVSIPKALYYHQRRNSFRVPISVTTPINVAFSTKNDVLMHAELRDISTGGFSARINSPVSEQLSVGDEVPVCIIQIPDEGKVVSSLEIARVEQIGPLQNTKIGARFMHISKNDQEQLSRYIAKLDRENLKKLKRMAE